MRLENAEIRPGKVMRVEDAFGTIKGSCAGFFSEEDDPDALPPIRPFFRISPSSFTQPRVNDPIWVLLFRDNPQELFYFFQADVSDTASDTLKDANQDAEILSRRSSGTGMSQLMFNSDDGWVMENDLGKIQIDNDSNDITLSKSESNRTIDINENGISLGTKGGSAEPAVLGNKLSDCLDAIYDILDGIMTSAAGSPYTAHIASKISAQVPQVRAKANKILSNNVTLD